jgi:hypothetical protein
MNWDELLGRVKIYGVEKYDCLYLKPDFWGIYD